MGSSRRRRTIQARFIDRAVLALVLGIAALTTIAATAAPERGARPGHAAAKPASRAIVAWKTACVRRLHHGRRVRVGPRANLAQLVARNPPRTTFCVAAGVHRFSAPVVPKAGSTFIGQPGAIFSGAEDITKHFSPSGSAWAASGMTMEGSGSAACIGGGTLCLRTNDVYYDDRLLTRVGSLAELSPGRFFFDYDADKIYIADTPSGHKVEVGVAPQALRSFGTGAVNVTLRGIVVEKFATPANGYTVEGKAGWVLDDVEIRLNHACGAHGPVLENSLVHDNGQCGFTGDDGPVLVQNSEFYANHRTPIECTHTASVKILRSVGAVVRNNYAHDEECLALWTDWDNVRTLYEGNRVVRVGGPGIFHEASFDAVIRNNVVRNSGFAHDFDGWVDGAGILVNTSRNVEIYGNTVIGNRHGIAATNTDRGSSARYGLRQLTNLRVHDNVIRVRAPGAVAGVAGIIKQPFLGQAFYDRNRYTICGSAQFVGPTALGSTAYGYVPLSAWRATGEDRKSTVSIRC